MRPVLITDSQGERPISVNRLRSLHHQLDWGRWEVEIGFGKGRFLVDEAQRRADGHFLGIEMAAKYYRLVCDRAQRRGLDNVCLLCGEATYVLASLLPQGFADRVHVYFPDPWPKDRHSKRRLMDADAVDLVLSLLKPQGELLFASDHPAYGEQVDALLRSHPSLEVESVDGWPGGPRTNYEAKFVDQGKPIVRLICKLVSPVVQHPWGAPLAAASGAV